MDRHAISTTGRVMMAVLLTFSNPNVKVIVTIILFLKNKMNLRTSLLMRYLRLHFYRLKINVKVIFTIFLFGKKNDFADCLIDGYTITVYKIKVCENGFYNANCTGRCGHCQNGQACDRESGNCFNGCSSNFQKPLCQGV